MDKNILKEIIETSETALRQALEDKFTAAKKWAELINNKDVKPDDLVDSILSFLECDAIFQDLMDSWSNCYMTIISQSNEETIKKAMEIVNLKKKKKNIIN